MNEARLTVLEPLLLLRAARLARELPDCRRGRVRHLAQAASVRERLAREVREPESLPAALCLSREAISLSVMAAFTARGLDGGTLRELGFETSAELGGLLATEDPAYSDGLRLETQRALLSEADALLLRLRRLYEPRTLRELRVQRGLRLLACVLLLFILISAPFFRT